MLNELSDAELSKRYRLDRHGILYVTDLVGEALSSDTKRRHLGGDPMRSETLFEDIGVLRIERRKLKRFFISSVCLAA